MEDKKLKFIGVAFPDLAYQRPNVSERGTRGDSAHWRKIPYSRTIWSIHLCVPMIVDFAPVNGIILL